MKMIDNPRILCAGLTPCIQRTVQCRRFLRGEVNRARSVTVSTGGKAVNVARALKTLGSSPILAGIAGGETGLLLMSLLREMGIENDFVRSAGATRICTTVVEDEGGTVTEIVEEAAVPAEAELSALYEKIAGFLPLSPLVVAAGALPPGAPADIYARLAEAAAPSGPELIIDTHGEALVRVLPFRPLVVKLNREELGMTLGRRVSAEDHALDAAGGLLSLGARWVLVTDGGRPALLAGAEGAWRFIPAAVAVVNGVGCGDAATAGIARALSLGEPMPAAVRLGMACGAANAATLTPCDIDSVSVGKFLDAVGVEEVV